jgi:AcrR family transcriptional regulator
MPRPSQQNQKRRELIPVVARAFAELGYRRATTAQLAARCGVQETILYRLWPDKKAMFIAAIEHVYALSEATWKSVGKGGPSAARGRGGQATAAERMLDHEADHLGEFGNARIIFAGLGETDDPDIRRAMRRLYQQYQGFIAEQLRANTATACNARDAALRAWALIGLGTVASIARELDLLDAPERKALMLQAGGRLLRKTT